MWEGIRCQPCNDLPKRQLSYYSRYVIFQQTEICHDVEVEPKLQPLTSERLSHHTANVEEEARLDVKARGFWDSSGVARN